MERIETQQHVVHITIGTDDDGDDEWRYDVFHPGGCAGDIESCGIADEINSIGAADLFDGLAPGFHRFSTWIEVYTDWETGVKEADGGRIVVTSA